MEMHLALFIHDTRDIEDRTDPQPRWLAHLFAAIATAGSALRAELRARRAAAELASLDDHMLRDIGVGRSEIQTVVRRPTASAAQHIWWRRSRQVGRN